MLRQFARLGLSASRPLSTASQQPTRNSRRRLQFALAASAVTGTYLAWHWASDRHRVALDDTNTSSTEPPQPVADGASVAPPPLAQPESSPEVSASAPEPPDAHEDDAQEADPHSSGGAFNPTTGEINWDCPCLGGMAHGPCGPQFREAFSCFVFSKEEPKGFDCVDKFQAMQNCFREHPDVYADEIMDDEEDEEPSVGDTESAADAHNDGGSSSPQPDTSPPPSENNDDADTAKNEH